MPTATLARDLGISQADLDRLWTGIERHLAEHPPTRPGIVLPPVDQLIAQAGIILGPAPREPRKLPWRRPRKVNDIAEHLEAVAGVIERYGWTKGALACGTARCILGAQYLLIETGHSTRETAQAAADLLTAAMPAGTSYMAWNDNPCRTRGEVTGLLRRLAADARREAA
jgi:hypothetical protein